MIYDTKKRKINDSKKYTRFQDMLHVQKTWCYKGHINTEMLISDSYSFHNHQS